MTNNVNCRCSVKRLYILLRPKKQQTPQERIAKIYSTALFDQLRTINPEFMELIGIIDGDMGAPMLGIRAADVQVLSDTVDIVIHAAANVRFDCPLPEILLCNVRGTRDLLRMAAGFGRLMSFVYVSTAFAHANKLNRFTDEQFYTSPMDPDSAIRLAEREKAIEQLDLLTDKIINPWPNTYSFSKSIAEELVGRAVNTLPIVVVRPSVGNEDGGIVLECSCGSDMVSDSRIVL